MSDTTTEAGVEGTAGKPRPFVFDVSTVEGRTNEEMMGGSPEAEALFELLGRDLVTRTLVQTPQLCVYHETAKPGEAVKPHRHGTYQVNYVLRGELRFGNQRVGPGMGYFTPDMLYSWKAGDEGAEWIEIHSGIGGIYTDRPETLTEHAPMRIEQPDAYLRGCAWPGTDDWPYPRANPADVARLPLDTAGVARLPVGVRLELVGDATQVEIAYTTATAAGGFRSDGGGIAFTALCGDDVVADVPAVEGSSTAVLELPERAADSRVVVYLPEAMQPRVLRVGAASGSIEPAPPQPRWLAYGDSIVEGWVASGPPRAWPAIAGRRYGLDVCNLGYAGAARGELASAEQIASVAADVISISYGTNCWTRVPFSAELMRANTAAFLDLVRRGHPDTPIVVTSPVVRDGEEQPNALGATLDDLRVAMEELVRERIAAGDPQPTLVEGGPVLDPADLADGVHPGDDGHAKLAAVFGGAVATNLAGAHA